MNNKKELMNKEVKEGYKLIKEYYKNNKELNELIHNTHRFIYNKSQEGYDLMDKQVYSELKAQEDEMKKEVQKLKDKVEIQKNMFSILKNNLKLQVIEILKNEMFENLKKYANKNIGEKTKAKIENEIEVYFEKNYNLIISVNLSLKDFFTYCDQLHIEIYENYTIEKNYYNNDYKSFKNRFSIDSNTNNILISTGIYTATIDEVKYKNMNVENYVLYNDKYYLVAFYNDDLEFVELENIKAKAKETYKEWKKVVKELETLKNKMETLKNDYNNTYTHGFLSYNYIDLNKIR